MTVRRISTGVPGLDAMLGGGLIAGTLTVVVGATGIGKTQLGIQIAHAGEQGEGRRGILFDMSARGDPQSHAEYAGRMFRWPLSRQPSEEHVPLDNFYAPERNPHDYLHVFDYRGQRVTRRDLEWEDWRAWQLQLNAKLQTAIAFLYGNLVHGTKRVVVDGIEPTDRPGESIQFNLFEYVYHQVLRKDPEWVARDLFREKYRHYAEQAASHRYDPSEVACVLLVTSHESMLDDLISRPLSEGDAIANANTLIFMGKVREGSRMGRALYVAKHRGSACVDTIVPYRVTNDGVTLLPEEGSEGPQAGRS